MDILLLTDNATIKKLVELSANKLGLSYIDQNSTEEIHNDYRFIIVDNDLVTDEILELLPTLTATKIAIVGKASPRPDGFNVFLQKPFLPTELVEILSSVPQESEDTTPLTHNDNEPSNELETIEDFNDNEFSLDDNKELSLGNDFMLDNESLVLDELSPLDNLDVDTLDNDVLNFEVPHDNLLSNDELSLNMNNELADTTFEDELSFETQDTDLSSLEFDETLDSSNELSLDNDLLADNDSKNVLLEEAKNLIDDIQEPFTDNHNDEKINDDDLSSFALDNSTDDFSFDNETLHETPLTLDNFDNNDDEMLLSTDINDDLLSLDDTDDMPILEEKDEPMTPEQLEALETLSNLDVADALGYELEEDSLNETIQDNNFSTDLTPDSIDTNPIDNITMPEISVPELTQAQTVSKTPESSSHNVDMSSLASQLNASLLKEVLNGMKLTIHISYEK